MNSSSTPHQERIYLCGGRSVYYTCVIGESRRSVLVTPVGM